ncbi:DUF1868 domain-containing protein [Labrys okinawensis]|uniref:DUF1868 domain-containing protein n=1 Tax=Labrys okinawensis TaxID=346911 RepID=UPI0039BD7B7E
MSTASIKPSLQQFAASTNRSRPRHLGTRYDRQGRFLPEPGNTVVCHVVPDTATERALVAVRERLMAMPDAGSLAFTPVASLHMTLFQGIIEYRRHWPYWPQDQLASTSIDVMTRLYRERLADFRPPVPFKVHAVDVTPTEVVLEGATPEDRNLLGAWRDGLAEVFGYRHPDHERYRFHVTLSYPVEWLADGRLEDWQSVLDESLALLQREAPVLELRPPAFCSFSDMEHFEELLVLEGREALQA